jgi:hypothetical protein
VCDRRDSLVSAAVSASAVVAGLGSAEFTSRLCVRALGPDCGLSVRSRRVAPTRVTGGLAAESTPSVSLAVVAESGDVVESAVVVVSLVDADSDPDDGAPVSAEAADRFRVPRPGRRRGRHTLQQTRCSPLARNVKCARRYALGNDAAGKLLKTSI